MNSNNAGQYLPSPGVPPADSPLRERQILMLQQTLHNARVVSAHERLEVIRTCTGRSVTSLREVRQGELRRILDHVQRLTAQSSV